QAGVKASFAGVSGGVDSKAEESRERLRTSSQCTVFGKGGDVSMLAAMCSLDEASYKAWLDTVKDNPQVIEFDVAGIWTLIEDKEQADALKKAYRAMVTFEPLSAAIEVSDEVHDRIYAKIRSQTKNRITDTTSRKIYFIRGDKFIIYDRDTKVTE